MTTIPLVFSGDQIRALQDGRKTQALRVGGRMLQPGDCIWARETWGISTGPVFTSCCVVRYQADWTITAFEIKGITDIYGAHKSYSERWRAPATMPRWASRILLEVTAPSRMLRLAEVTEDDITTMGVIAEHGLTLGQTFMELWDKSHKPATCWYVNPWVCMHTFSRVADPPRAEYERLRAKFADVAPAPAQITTTPETGP